MTQNITIVSSYLICGAFYVSHLSKDLVRFFFPPFTSQAVFESLQKVTHHRWQKNMKINQKLLQLFLSLVFTLHLQGENSLQTQHSKQPPLPTTHTIKMEFMKIKLPFNGSLNSSNALAHTLQTDFLRDTSKWKQL